MTCFGAINLLRASGSWRLMEAMAGFEHQPERAWDEYDWERFLQQQDHKTEKYMELLEKYLDDPQRDQIIAREMGWTQLLRRRRIGARKSTRCWRRNRG